MIARQTVRRLLSQAAVVSAVAALGLVAPASASAQSAKLDFRCAHVVEIPDGVRGYLCKPRATGELWHFSIGTGLVGAPTYTCWQGYGTFPARIDGYLCDRNDPWISDD